VPFTSIQFIAFLLWPGLRRECHTEAMEDMAWPG
jgi:hypothetical protein